MVAYAKHAGGDRVSLGAFIDAFGQRSIGALLLLLALPMALPVPTPGLSVLFGVPLLLVAVQLSIGRRRAWMPERLAGRSISRSEFATLVDRALPILRRFERIIRPRAAWLVRDWLMIPVGLVCALLALIIILPIPLGHVVPGSAICLLALGMIERDGLAIGLGLLTACAALVVVGLASSGLIEVLAQL